MLLYNNSSVTVLNPKESVSTETTFWALRKRFQSIERAPFQKKRLNQKASLPNSKKTQQEIYFCHETTADPNLDQKNAKN